LINGKSYVGSAKNLKNRLIIYYCLECIKKRLKKSSSYIHKAILKHGYSNFCLDILEYCESNLLIEKEQFYFDILKPEYNICKVAGSTLGKKHRPETILKIKASYKYDPKIIAKIKLTKQNNPLNPEIKAKISAALKGRKHSTEAISKLRLKASTIVFATNIKNNLIVQYSSIIDAATNLNVCTKTIHNYANTGKVLKDIYLIKKSTKIHKVHNSISTTIINSVTQEVCKFSSIKEVANKFNVSDTIIKYYIKNNKKFKNIFIIKEE
jgi:group I intron endonuclease